MAELGKPRGYDYAEHEPRQNPKAAVPQFRNSPHDPINVSLIHVASYTVSANAAAGTISSLQGCRRIAFHTGGHL